MTVRPPRGPALLALVWLAGLVVATTVGVLAVRLVAAQVGDPAVAPLSAAAAASAAPRTVTSAGPVGSPSPVPSSTVDPPSATAVPSAPRGPAASPPAPPAPRAAVRAFTSAGGAVGVSCVGTTLRLLYATPADGYALDERTATGSEAEVRFEGDVTRVRLTVSCASGQPRLVEQRTDGSSNGRGRDDDRDDGSSGGDEDADEDADDD